MQTTSAPAASNPYAAFLAQMDQVRPPFRTCLRVYDQRVSETLFRVDTGKKRKKAPSQTSRDSTGKCTPCVQQVDTVKTASADRPTSRMGPRKPGAGNSSGQRQSRPSPQPPQRQPAGAAGAGAAPAAAITLSLAAAANVQQAQTAAGGSGTAAGFTATAHPTDSPVHTAAQLQKARQPAVEQLKPAGLRRYVSDSASLGHAVRHSQRRLSSWISARAATGGNSPILPADIRIARFMLDFVELGGNSTCQ